MNDPIEINVSLPMAGHTGRTLLNLITLTHNIGPLLNKALGTDFRVDTGLVKYLRAYKTHKKELTMDSLFDLVESYEGEHGKCADGLIIEPDKITFSATLPTEDADRLRTYITICSKINQYALKAEYIPLVREHQNERLNMRIMLLEFEMDGPDFTRDQQLLMQNLSGSWGPYRKRVADRGNSTSPDDMEG